MPAVRVMTQNLYVGGDIARVVTAEFPAGTAAAVQQTLTEVVLNDFPARAQGVADAIVAVQPHLVGLQEVSVLEFPTASGKVRLDYLEILLAALGARGLHYEVASVVHNLEIDLMGVYLLDRDVILARADLPPGQFQVGNGRSGNFQAAIPIQFGSQQLAILRGWCSVDVFMRGRVFQFLNVHTDDANVQVPPYNLTVREMQIAELLAGPAASPLPILAVGDFNSDAISGGADGYQQLLSAGFRDAWVETGHSELEGATWGRSVVLDDPLAPLVQRLDLVLCRGAILRPDEMDILATSPASMVPSNYGYALWPSDHAGLCSVIGMPAPVMARGLPRRVLHAQDR